MGLEKNESIEKIDIITKIYTNGGFTMIPYNGDNALKMLTYHVGSGNLNIVGRDYHVGAIERSIRKDKVYMLQASIQILYEIND